MRRKEGGPVSIYWVAHYWFWDLGRKGLLSASPHGSQSKNGGMPSEPRVGERAGEHEEVKVCTAVNNAPGTEPGSLSGQQHGQKDGGTRVVGWGANLCPSPSGRVRDKVRTCITPMGLSEAVRVGMHTLECRMWHGDIVPSNRKASTCG